MTLRSPGGNDHIKDINAAKEAVIEAFAELVRVMNRPALHHFLLEIFEINSLKKIELLGDLSRTPDNDIGSVKERIIYALRQELTQDTTIDLIASHVERIFGADPGTRDRLLARLIGDRSHIHEAPAPQDDVTEELRRDTREEALKYPPQVEIGKDLVHEAPEVVDAEFMDEDEPPDVDISEAGRTRRNIVAASLTVHRGTTMVVDSVVKSTITIEPGAHFVTQNAVKNTFYVKPGGKLTITGGSVKNQIVESK